MSEYTSILRKAFTTPAAFAPYTFGKYSANGGEAVPAAAASDLLAGVSDEVGQVDAGGGRVELQLLGVAQLELGGSVTRGGEVTSDANGKGVAAVSTNFVGAIALSSGVVGDIIPVQQVGYFKP